MVLRGNADEKILLTYNEERIEVATRLLETTDRFFDLLVNPAWFVAFARTQIFPLVANMMLGFESVNQFVFPLISQIGITYRDRSLSLENEADLEVKAGDRMPYFLVDGKSIYDRLHEPKFHLLVFSDRSEDHDTIKSEIEREFPNLVSYDVLPLNPAAEIFGTDSPFSVLLRPDNYIGFVSPEISFRELRAYLNNCIGHPQARVLTAEANRQ
jgi:hypothetical protein